MLLTFQYRPDLEKNKAQAFRAFSALDFTKAETPSPGGLKGTPPISSMVNVKDSSSFRINSASFVIRSIS
jgi:hypothetical protein